MDLLENPDPRRYREARAAWEELFVADWPDGIPCFIERSNRRCFSVPLFTREVAERLVVFYNDRHTPGVDGRYRWAGDRLLICYLSDELDREDNASVNARRSRKSIPLTASTTSTRDFSGTNGRISQPGCGADEPGHHGCARRCACPPQAARAPPGTRGRLTPSQPPATGGRNERSARGSVLPSPGNG
jgi:hypothetical protein